MALASCRECKRECDRHRLRPAQVYLTLLKMYEALKAAGLIERAEEEPRDLCDGCVECVNGSCRRGYQTVVLDANRKKVVKCLLRREARK